MARYIDADHLIKKYEDVIDDEWNKQVAPPSWSMAWECTIGDIEDEPTADVVEVKHGKWKLHPDGSGTCDQCGRTQKSVWDYDNAQRYCGCCGAKMDGQENEE